MTYLLKWIAWILVVIGALNWGLVGFLGYNPLEMLPGTVTMIIYDIVGISAIVLIFFKVAKVLGMKKKK